MSTLAARAASARAARHGGCAGRTERDEPDAASFARADTAASARTLDSLASRTSRRAGYAVLNVDTGERLARRGDETFPTASLIKVPILVTVFDLVEQGSSRSTIRSRCSRSTRCPAPGNLQFMHDGATLSVRDAAWLMSVTSDNTATNLLLDRILIRRVWDKMEKLGLPHTKVHSKTFLRMASVAMDSSVKYGLGVTTPNEMARLFGLLAEGKAVSPEGGQHDARHPGAQRGLRVDAAAHRGADGAAQDGRDGPGAHRVRAVPAAVARGGVRADEGETPTSAG
jgi:beta-lactamase class A